MTMYLKGIRAPKSSEEVEAKLIIFDHPLHLAQGKNEDPGKVVAVVQSIVSGMLMNRMLVDNACSTYNIRTRFQLFMLL